jgi:UDP-N-acetylglucosamine 2-epimerase (non-hydrolysing)
LNFEGIGIDYQNQKVILLTAHRRENLGEPMRHIFSAIKEIVLNNRDTEVVFPVYLNPKVRELAQKVLGGIDRIHLIDPLDYVNMPS